MFGNLFEGIENTAKIFKYGFFILATLYIINIASSVWTGLSYLNPISYLFPSVEVQLERKTEAYNELQVKFDDLEAKYNLLTKSRQKTWKETLWSGEEHKELRLNTADSVLNGYQIHPSNEFVLQK